jgi:serine/threonine protein kinase
MQIYVSLLKILKKKKVVDFGISGFFCNDPTQAGSLKYLPPEVLIDQVPANPGVDIWAMGCILYRLIHGYAPFDGSTKLHIMERIINNECEINPKVEKEVTPECIDLIKRMLTKDPKERINMLEVSNHVWLKSSIADL